MAGASHPGVTSHRDDRAGDAQVRVVLKAWLVVALFMLLYIFSHIDRNILNLDRAAGAKGFSG